MIREAINRLMWWSSVCSTLLPGLFGGIILALLVAGGFALAWAVGVFL